MPKITIVGAGNVGSQAAFYAALKQLGDIVLIDIDEGLAKGKALDLMHSMPIAGSNIKIKGGNDYSLSKDSDIVVITAGLARKPGMSRDDLLEKNAAIVKSVVKEIVKYSPESILIIVTNPLDAMVYLAHKISGFPKNRVLGMAGVLDSARLRAFIAHELNIDDINSVESMVLGGHGDLMVPLIGHSKINGKPVSQVLSSDKIEALVERTRNGGAEIVGLLKTGSAFFAPGLAIIEMVESIIKDQKKILPCAVLLEGEYGHNNVFAGVPVKLGKDGAEEVVELELTEKEKTAFDSSVNHVKELIEKLEKVI